MGLCGGCRSSRCELEGKAERSGAGHIAPSVFGAGVVPSMGRSTKFIAGENREKEE